MSVKGWNKEEANRRWELGAVLVMLRLITGAMTGLSYLAGIRG